MYPYFDIKSYALYLLIALLGGYILYSSISSKWKYTSKIYYSIFFWLYVLLGSFRIITYGIVGTDSYNYKELFLTCLTGGGRFEEQDIGFLIFTKLIRHITDSVIIYEFICYSIITYGYIYFIKNFSKRGISCLPFILIIIPYLKSLNTMRSSIAIAIFLIGLVYLKRNKNIWGSLIIILTFFIHRMSILYILYLPFYYIFKRYFRSISDTRLLLYSIIVSLISYSVAKKFQQYAVAVQLLDGTDAYYISKTLNGSIFDSIITLIPLIALGCMWWFNNKRIPNTRLMFLIKSMIVFDIILTPSANLLGFWRANEYFYIPRLIFWAYLIPIFYTYFKKNNKRILRYSFFTMFFFWLCYRILREWEPCGLMPYLPFWY